MLENLQSHFSCLQFFQKTKKKSFFCPKLLEVVESKNKGTLLYYQGGTLEKSDVLQI